MENQADADSGRVHPRVLKISIRDGGMEFYDVHFSYIDSDSLEEKFTSVPEQRGGTLIPEGPPNPGTLHTVGMGTKEHMGLYRIVEIHNTGPARPMTLCSLIAFCSGLMGLFSLRTMILYWTIISTVVKSG